MMKYTLVLLMACIHAAAFCQRNTEIAGTVKDELTGSLLEGATVTMEGSRQTVLSDRMGRFRLLYSGSGKQRLTISYTGYLSYTKELVVSEGETINLDVVLAPDIKPGNEVVVSAFLRPEKMYEAAASIHIINRKAFERFAGSNPMELMATVPGIEYTRNGLADITFNARGLHSAFNNRVLQIVDGRNSMAALSGTLPIMNRGTFIKDDIERMEIVLGPQSAIYGPNAHNAVFNIVTKDPRKHSGTSISASAGSRSQFSTRLRHAHVINSKWAYKLTAEQATGEEYHFYDSVYAGNQTGGTPFFGPPVGIPSRVNDFGFRHLRGEGSVYYSLRPGTDIIFSGGSSEHNFIQVTTAGRNQMSGIVYSYAQARLMSERWYASIYNTWGSLGNSYGLAGYTRDYWNRTHSSLPPSDTVRGRLFPDEAEVFAMRIGNRFKEKSKRLNGEVRYNYNFIEQGLFLALGANFQEERPNGYGITLVDSFHRIRIRQAGLAAQAEKHLPLGLRFIAATRFDHHENFGGFLSPRFALVKSVPDGAFRISWARAYSMPSIQNQYAGINRVFFGNATGILYLPNGERVSNTEARLLTSPLKPEQISTWEAGFKGALLEQLYLDINFYHGLSKNFISPPRTIGGRVYEVNGIPVTHNPNTAGIVTNDTLKGASFVTSLNYGEVSAYGMDVALRYMISRRISLQMNYSWFGSDITKNDMKNDANRDGYVSLEETSLNAPRNRGLIALNFDRIGNRRWSAAISARLVEQYDFYSGSQVGTNEGKNRRGLVLGPPDPVTGAPRVYVKNFDYGPLGGFATVDLSTSYDFNDHIRMNIGVTNLFDTKQVEFVSAPSIGRLVMAELRVRVW